MTIESREAFTDEFGSLIVGLSNPKKSSGSPKKFTDIFVISTLLKFIPQQFEMGITK